MRRAARVDDNQPEIVKVFRNLGWYVLIISQLKNCCDIIVSKNGVTTAVEIKDGAKPKSSQKLTEGELKFRDEWQGDYALITSIDDVIKHNRRYIAGQGWLN
jgi:Holliday junction resolvase